MYSDDTVNPTESKFTKNSPEYAAKFTAILKTVGGVPTMAFHMFVRERLARKCTIPQMYCTMPAKREGNVTVKKTGSTVAKK